MEYRNYLYVSGGIYINAVKEDLLSPSLSFQQLFDNLQEPIRRCFISNDEVPLPEIVVNAIIVEYRQRRKTSIELYDLLIHQQGEFEMAQEQLQSIRIILQDNRERERYLLRKKRVMRETIKSQVENVISPLMQAYISLITKAPPQFPGEDAKNILSAMVREIERYVHNMDSYIDAEFYLKSITARYLVPGQIDGIEQEILPESFIQQYIKPQVDKIANLIFEYKDFLPETVYIDALELKSVMLESWYMNIMNSGYSVANAIIEDYSSLTNSLKRVGEIILSINHDLLESI